ncbi:uncharacterized protein LOC115760496 isoform X1 [Drosophila novamexicana]|uniref:uncharacterized protein LOC115760496 isoform X1 n=2 Tax=Drosophila novamexicana TaxID=47314 RepID=UPI0011E60031|nr:uncharacterized protein LOC115760496 isoform X1 [Drosophila novamexicana]
MSKGMLIHFLKLFIFIVISCNYAEGVYYKIKNIECKANRSHFENISCILKPINWTRSILNMDGDIIGNLTNAFLFVETFYRDHTNLYKPFIFKFKYNICQLLDKRKPSNFLERYALLHLKSLTNINHSCPYSGHLFARNFHLDELSLPPLPLQEYKIIFNFTQNNPSINLAIILLYFEAREDYHKRTRPARF